MRLWMIAALAGSGAALLGGCSKADEGPAPATPAWQQGAEDEIELARRRGEYNAEMSARIAQLDDRIARLEQRRSQGIAQLSDKELSDIYQLRQQVTGWRAMVEGAEQSEWAATSASFERAYQQAWDAVEEQLERR